MHCLCRRNCEDNRSKPLFFVNFTKDIKKMAEEVVAVLVAVLVIKAVPVVLVLV